MSNNYPFYNVIATTTREFICEYTDITDDDVIADVIMCTFNASLEELDTIAKAVLPECYYNFYHHLCDSIAEHYYHC